MASANTIKATVRILPQQQTASGTIEKQNNNKKTKKPDPVN